ncbi:sigma-70 family RNA polymerase sigma factor [Haloferula sp. BvORR071]|uniref:sigma-70 family RNA polymerase sigma factor n=1 Tax=Haloferula sp. BvORR071 TaxID=1396141 RepID=UPI000554835D|nr:sigma-70 family RNA polymerase sigma factor [Haloferula sp. BvORR071]
MSAEPHNAEERIVGLIARHQPEIHRYILSLLPDRMLADDVVQETNLVLWRKAADYDPSQPFLPWAFTIALYQVKAARRDAGRDRHVFDDSLVEILAAEGREAESHGGDLEKALESCLQELPEKQRQLILARYAPGNSVQALAAERSQTPTALSLTLMRIRKALETCIERKLALP